MSAPKTPVGESPGAENTEAESPGAENADARNPDAGNPDTGNPDTGNPDTGNPDTGNTEANATRRRLLTGTAVGLAALTGGGAAGLWPAFPAEAASTSTGRTVLTASNDTAGVTDTANINSAPQASCGAIHANPKNPPATGPAVYLSAGVYCTNAWPAARDRRHDVQHHHESRVRVRRDTGLTG